MNPEVKECSDGLDIITDHDSWYAKNNKPVLTEAYEEDGKMHIKFRKSNGDNPLHIKEISGIPLGDYAKRLIDGEIGIDYTNK